MNITEPIDAALPDVCPRCGAGLTWDRGAAFGMEPEEGAALNQMYWRARHVKGGTLILFDETLAYWVAQKKLPEHLSEAFHQPPLTAEQQALINAEANAYASGAVPAPVLLPEEDR